MNNLEPSKVATFGLFEKRIEGDDCLLELARRRFLDAGMGAEMHAGTPEHFEWLMGYRPLKDEPVMVHLPRDFNLVDEAARRQILAFAKRFAGQLRGLVLHDHPTMVSRRDDFIAAAWQLDDELEKIERCPVVFVEYAAGLDPADYTRFFAGIPDLDRISACFDTGHVGIRAARAAYARDHSGDDVCALKSQAARLPQLMADVEAAVAAGYAAVFDLVEALSALKKPVHFHLHDGHPLSTISPYGVSDHVSFLAEIPLQFEHRGRRAVEPMFGPRGLAKLVRHAIQRMHPRRVSFTLEIHPDNGRSPLNEAAPLFAHWTDLSNAERMNHWLETLSQNHELLRRAIDASLPPAANAAAAGSDSGPCAI